MHTGISMRRTLLFALVVLLGPACSSDPAEPSSADPAHVIRVSSLAVPATPWYDGWRAFEARLNQLDGHGLTAELFITGQLGSEETVLSGLRRNRVQLGGFSLHGLATVVPELSLLLAPYLFESESHADFVIDRYLSDIYRDLLAEHGIKLLAWSEVGWNHVYATRPVQAPSDLQRMPMRTSNAEATRLFAEAVGARTINITFADLHTALQTGMVTSGQSGIGMYLMTGISREAPHLLLTGHAYDTGVTVANREWWQALGESQREAILQALGTQDEGRRTIRKHLATLQHEAFADPHITITQLSPEQQASWQALGRSTHAAIVAGSGPRGAEIYELVMRATQEWRARSQADYQHNTDPS